jgi:hypothetical protein
MVQTSMGQNQDPISKITRAIRAGGVALVVECLPSKLKAKFKPQNHIKKKKKKIHLEGIKSFKMLGK